VGERREAGHAAPRLEEWTIPAADVLAGAAELGRLLHAALPGFRWGRRNAGGWTLGPAPPPRRLATDLTDGEHAGFLVRLAGLLSFLGAHGLGLSPEGARAIGARPGSRDVPWLAAPPVPAWRAAPAFVVLGSTVLRLAGRGAPSGSAAEARRALEDGLADGLPPRAAEALAAALRSTAAARPSEALLLDFARTGDVGERVAPDLLGLVLPRELEPPGGDRRVATGAAAEWIARGAVRRGPGEIAFAEAGPSSSLEDFAALLDLADALGPDPRGAVLRAVARGERAEASEGPPLALLARDLDAWDAPSRRVWEDLPRSLAGAVRVETRGEPPPPWQAIPLLVPRLGREEVSGLVHLPLGSPSAFSRLWEGLADEAGGDAGLLLRAARARARAFLAGIPGASPPRRAPAPPDVVLRAAALLGDGFGAPEAAAVAGVDERRAMEALADAWDSGTFVRAGRDSYRFADDGRRLRLLGTLSRSERTAGVARLAASGAGPFRLLLARLASGSDAECVAEARARFADAAAAGRTGEAVALLARAPASDADLGDPLRAVEVHIASGRPDRARASASRVEPAAALREPRSVRERVARMLGRLGEAETALALLPDGPAPEDAATRADLLLRLRREEEASRLVRDLVPGTRALAARVHLLRAELYERRQEVAAAERELAAAATALDDPAGGGGLVDERFAAGYVALGLRRPREAQAFFRAARDEAPDASRRADALYDLSVAYAESGEIAQAEESLEEALALFSAAGETDRYLGALGQRADLALRRSDAPAARRDLRRVLEHDRAPGRTFHLLFSVPARQRLALADGDDGEAAEAFAEARPGLGACPDHPARREILVLEGARLLAGSLAAEALSRLEEARPLPDARSGVEPLRSRLETSARLDLGLPAPVPEDLSPLERSLLGCEARLARGEELPAALARELSERLERPDGPLQVATRLLELRGRFPAAFASEAAGALRETALRAARRAGLDGAAARFAAPASGAAPADVGATPVPAASFVAEDAATREVFEKARRVARSRLPVLLLGESGTGKEVLAREIHRASGRKGPFVAVNVAALPDTLAEAELFGVARGAFTGADRDRAGVVEASSGGTLFLDEIGDLSPRVQGKLLRVLQEREVRRLGEAKTRPVDLRLVSATHRDLEALVAEGTFRGDLLYRVAGMSLTLPPLRDRPRDLRLLLERALEGAAVAPEARSALLSWNWPGNVRELHAAVESARVLAGPGGRIGREHLPPSLRADRPAGDGRAGRYRAAVDDAKRRVILAALAEAGRNRTRAAALLGLSRQSLLYEIRRLAIRD